MTIAAPTTPATFLNYNSYNTASTAGTLTPATVEPFTFTLNVGLVLDRAGGIDPTAPGGLLTLNWAERQAELKTLTAGGASVFSTYGAATQDYSDALTALATLGINQVTSPGYVSSQESRTIWVQVDQSNFSTLLGADMGVTTDSSGHYYLSWQGELTINPSLGQAVQGLVFDTAATVTVANAADPSTAYTMYFTTPVMPSTPPSGSGVQLTEGAQSPGNSTASEREKFPNTIADLYNYPLDDAPDGLNWPTIGLIEPGLGNASPTSTTLSTYLNDYLGQIGFTDPNVTVNGVQAGGTASGTNLNDGERVLDVSVLGAVAPNSTQVLYAGSGYANNAQSAAFTAYQSAIFDTINNPNIVSSSWGMGANNPAPWTAFAWTFQQMFVDAALANITMVVANGDVGSGRRMASGVANTALAENSPYNLMVGGTSISNMLSASTDTTIASLWDNARAFDPNTLWKLVQGGLTSLPDLINPTQWFTEMVWNEYHLTGNSFVNGGNDSSYFANLSGAGGQDRGQGIPSYQADLGLGLEGRGLPDVSAAAGGNLDYAVPQSDWSTMPNSSAPNGFAAIEGTSAATPLWASLIAQIDTVFNDQGLPNLGYMNDLLYIAAAINPASFNDVTDGNNNSSFYYGAGTYSYETLSDGTITPTNIGYEAGPGYDLASGLGSPNGMVLARTLAAIAHTQTNNHVGDHSEAVISVINETSGTSTVSQTLLVQNYYTGAAGATTLVQLLGMDSIEMTDESSLGWTDRIAGAVVQGDNFDGDLLPYLDGGAKSTPFQISVDAGEMLGASANGEVLSLYQQSLTNDYGFIRFGDDDGGITLARPVAIAETAGGVDGQEAVVRIRQNGGDQTQLEIYRVDDLNGGIDTGAGGVLMPGQAGYVAAAAARDYQLVGGGTVIDGPGQTNFAQATITGVNEGDIVALKYSNVTTGETYWSFSQANTVSNTSAIFAYGLNTWGFEDRPLTGDHDYQDLVVQLDFTSSAGHGLLV
jgi:hypothetical protein